MRLIVSVRRYAAPRRSAVRVLRYTLRRCRACATSCRYGRLRAAKGATAMTTMFSACELMFACSIYRLCFFYFMLLMPVCRAMMSPANARRDTRRIDISLP